MVVMEPVEPTIFAQSWPVLIPDSPINCSRAEVILTISGPILKFASID
jgi:hypothetical protein